MNEQDLLQKLDTTADGLTSPAAEQRLASHGPNELVRKKRQPLWLRFLRQFKDFMILVLIAAAIIAGVMGDITDTVIILVIVIINAVIGFVQEYRAEKAIEALKSMAAPEATVVRDGKSKTIAATDLVTGDKVQLEAGQIVSADIRLVEAHTLKLQEAALTGESKDVEKGTDPLREEDPPLGDRKNMSYKGTFVTSGRGTGIVVATGMDTEMGKIAGMLAGEDITNQANSQIVWRKSESMPGFRPNKS